MIYNHKTGILFYMPVVYGKPFVPSQRKLSLFAVRIQRAAIDNLRRPNNMLVVMIYDDLAFSALPL